MRRGCRLGRTARRCGGPGAGAHGPRVGRCVSAVRRFGLARRLFSPGCGDRGAGLPGQRRCCVAGAVSVMPVTRHGQRPARRSVSPFIVEILAFVETCGCYGCPFLPCELYVPRYCDGSRLQMRSGVPVTAADRRAATWPRAPRPVDGAWGTRTPSGPRDLREKRQPTRKSHHGVTTIRLGCWGLWG